ncbi:MAG: hypothetical protein V3U91_02980 [Candidatus Aminicenantaceae bacterium]
MGINGDYPIRPLDSRIDRTDRNTDGIVTVVTHDRQVKLLCMRIISFLDLFDPASPDS